MSSFAFFFFLFTSFVIYYSVDLDIDSFLVEDKDVSVNGVNGLLKPKQITD